MRKGLGLAATALAFGILVGGCQPVAPATTQIQTGRADAADGAISISTDDWTYAVPLEGVNWVDAMGMTHDSGRPECLVPGASREVKFAAVEVTIEGRTWRPVVWVSCQ